MTIYYGDDERIVLPHVFTGLTDNNGNRLYENDTVISGYGTPGIKAVITWDNSIAGFSLKWLSNVRVDGPLAYAVKVGNLVKSL